MGIGAIIAAIAGAISVIGTITTFIHKYYKRLKQVREDEAQRIRVIDKLPTTLARIEDKVDETSEVVNGLEAKFDLMDTQFLKYRITDAFYSYGELCKIPYEILVGAAQCGELYRRKGLNHEISVQVKLINEELERRQRQLADREKEKEESHE